MVRARKPFRIGNAAIGLALLCFVSGVYTYSIAAVKQDEEEGKVRRGGRKTHPPMKALYGYEVTSNL